MARLRHSPGIRVLAVVGTRPEAIKTAPVVLALRRHAPEVAVRVCVTGQHREMLDDVLRLFGITPHHNLDVMRYGQSPTQVAAEVLRRLEPVLADERPDWVVVQGDTTTAAAGALAAFYAGARVAHVEAGLRSHERREPFPEEMNRRIAGVLADLHFAPTETARGHLLAEGVPRSSVLVTGNTVIDALAHVRGLPLGPSAVDSLLTCETADRLVLVTAHRRESFGAPLERICTAVARLASETPRVHVVFPVHPNPAVQGVVASTLGDHPNVTLLEPLDYRAMVALLERCELVLTDSGGLQEEAPSLGTPVLVLRDVTERTEGIAAGAVRLVGTDTDRIVAEAGRLLRSRSELAHVAHAVNPYGDGLAAERITLALRGHDVAEWSSDPGNSPLRGAVGDSAAWPLPVAFARNAAAL